MRFEYIWTPTRNIFYYSILVVVTMYLLHRESNFNNSLANGFESIPLLHSENSD